MLRRTILLTCLLALGAKPGAAQKRTVTLDDITSPGADASKSIVWAPSGDRFAVEERGTLFVYSVKEGKQRDVIPLAKLDATAAKVSLPQSETANWTNRRVSERRIQWFADNRHLLVLASGDLFVVDVEKSSFESLTHTTDDERDPKLSPDNLYVSFRRAHDLYVVDLKTRAISRLTSDGSDTLLNAEPDWVYPEELELGTAHWWSPDSRSIAYLQFDVSREPLFPQISLLGVNGEVERQRYPKAGDPNPSVRLGVVAVTGGATKWMELGSTSENLLARVVWSPNSREVMAERLNRIQNKLDLLLANIQTGAAKTVLHEEDKYWINVDIEPWFPGTGDRFLWASERSGFRHLYIYGTDGKQRAQLTSGNWEVDKIVGVDEARQRVFYTSTEASPLERQLYSVAFDGSGKRRLTTGAGTHAASLSPGGAWYMDDYSSSVTPKRSTICSAEDGKEVEVYRDADRSIVDEIRFATGGDGHGESP